MDFRQRLSKLYQSDVVQCLPQLHLGIANSISSACASCCGHTTRSVGQHLRSRTLPMCHFFVNTRSLEINKIATSVYRLQQAKMPIFFWYCPPIVDTSLSDFMCLKHFRTDKFVCAMSSDSIVIHSDIFEYTSAIFFLSYCCPASIGFSERRDVLERLACLTHRRYSKRVLMLVHRAKAPLLNFGKYSV